MPRPALERPLPECLPIESAIGRVSAGYPVAPSVAIRSNPYGQSPGAYLRQQRETAGVSIELLGARVSTIPHATAEHERIEWLRRIEADDAPITADVADAYFALIAFDAVRLIELVLIHSGLAARRAAPVMRDVLELTAELQLPPAIGEAA